MRRPLVLASLVVLAAVPASAQGLMSGTGLQPSQQLATPPDTPAIDRPGAERASPAPRTHQRAAQPQHSATTKPADSRSAAPR